MVALSKQVTKDESKTLWFNPVSELAVAVELVSIPIMKEIVIM